MRAEVAISVIVPVYKVEKYLPKCVESLLNQSFHDLEIILVDDGSPDGCPALCDEFAARDARVRVIHKENGGLSSARNAGIEMARGRYIGFVDSDDYAEPEMYEVLYNLAEKNQADVSVCGFWICYTNGRHSFSPGSAPFVCSGEEALGRALTGDGLTDYVWTRLVRRELFDEGLRFPVGMNFEDVYVMPTMLLAAKKVAVDDRPFYNYIQRSGSITQERFQPRIMEAIQAYSHILDVVEERCPCLVPQAQGRLYWAHFYVLDKLLVTKNYRKQPQLKTLMRFMREHAGRIIRCPYISKARRVSMLALYVSPALYCLLLKWDSQQRTGIPYKD